MAVRVKVAPQQYTPYNKCITNNVGTINSDNFCGELPDDAAKNIQKELSVHSHLINEISNTSNKTNKVINNKYINDQSGNIPPSSITGVYINDYNIEDCDRVIRLWISYENSRLKKHIKRQQRLMCIIEDSIDDTERYTAIDQLSVLDTLIKGLQSGELEKSYIADTVRLIAAYKLVKHNSGTLTFGKKSKDTERALRIEIINNYLIAAKRYYNINVTHSTDSTVIICNKCKHVVNLEESDDAYCSNCYDSISFMNGGSVDANNNEIFNNDNNTSANVFKSEKTQRKDTFDHAMMCYQGKQKRVFKKEIDDLIKRNLATRALSLNEVSKETLKQIFKHNKLSDWYDDINLYHYHLTNINPPDISQYEELLRYKNSLIKQINKEVEAVEGIKYCLHGSFTLKVLLKSESILYSDDDFPSFLKTTDVVDKHNSNMKHIFNILQSRYSDMRWDYYYTT